MENILNLGRAFLVMIFLFLILTFSFASEDLVVHFIDVGQGDANLILSPNNKVVLIDGGPSNDPKGLKRYLESLSIKSIDMVIGTHSHSDHINGLKSVIENFEVKNYLDSGYPHTSGIYKDLLNEIKKREIPYKMAKRGRNIVIDQERGIILYILSPPEDKFLKSSISVVNANSVVSRLVYGKISFLFPGDAEVETENFILKNSDNIKSDVLKVAHHGSSTSTTIPFLLAVDPKIAVIECGKGNMYGFPHKTILDRLKDRRIEIFRTDLDGTVIIKTDGEKLEKITQNSNKADSKLNPSKESDSNSNNNSGKSSSPVKYVASVNSDYFHLVSCKYARKIKGENLITFESREEAINSGKKPAKCCNP